LFANERYDIIADMLARRKSVTVSELTERFGVSIETIRRDLAFLEKHGKLTRVHGGAIAVSDKSREFAELTVRLDENADKKRELSGYAASLVHENDVIALDAGSTTAELAHVLCKRFKKLTVITYSRDLVDILTENSEFSVICLGGMYLPSEHLFYGFLAEESLKHLHADLCFVAPSALSHKYGAMINTTEAYSIMHGFLEISDRRYIVADSTKFESTLPVRLCALDDADAIITDRALDAGICRLYHEKGLTIIKE